MVLHDVSGQNLLRFVCDRPLAPLARQVHTKPVVGLVRLTRQITRGIPVNHRVTLLFALGLTTVATTATVDTAEARRWRFGGGGQVRVHAQAAPGGVSVRYSRPAYRAPVARSWGISGHIYVGSYPRYRYYRPYYVYTPVPSYYGYHTTTYYPVQPHVSTTTTVVAPARPELPKFGVGLFAGGISVEDQQESSDLGLLARFRLTPGLLLEGELGKTSYPNDLRVDRRLGASLVYEIGAYNKFAPYVLAGLGAQQADIGGGQYTTTQNFAEIGVGLRLAVTPKFHILGDIRAGSRDTMSEEGVVVDGNTMAREVMPPSSDSSESEEYTRARLSAVVYF